MEAVSGHGGRSLRHVAVIMDGNGRWARERRIPREAGHRAGAEAVRRTLAASLEQGVPYLTLFAFSSENWRRPEPEVDNLMGLLRHHLRHEKTNLIEKGVRITFIGDRRGLGHDVSRLMADVEQDTAGGEALTATVAFNYGARNEIVRAARAMVEECMTAGLEPCCIDERRFAGRLDTHSLPDPDLIIRTGGERRLSNFLAWQGIYAELVFLDVLWPDFGGEHLASAISEYHRRDRRYGKITAS